LDHPSCRGQPGVPRALSSRTAWAVKNWNHALAESRREALDGVRYLFEWFTKQGYSAKDSEPDLIYVNGGNNLENL
jgi:hypothetical protein